MPAHSPPRRASPLIFATPASPPRTDRDAAQNAPQLESLAHQPPRESHEDRPKPPFLGRTRSSSSSASPASVVAQGPPPIAELAQGRRPSLLFVEPDVKQQRPSSQRGRERKRSFIGLGFMGRGGADPVELPVGLAGDPSGPHPSASTPVAAAPPRKSSSGPKALLRRAESFGTSPVLGGTKDGGFGPSTSAYAAPPASPPPLAVATSPPLATPSTVAPTSPALTLPRFSPSALSIDTSASASATPHSGTSTPFTSHSPYSHSSSTSAGTSASASTMVLPEPLPSQPHWLFAPAPAAGSSASAPRSSGERERSSGEGSASRRRSADERPVTNGNWKGKERTDERVENGPLVPTPKRKTRRATLGGLFGRKESKAAAAAAAEEARRSDEGVAASGAGSVVYDSPTGSPALRRSSGSSGQGIGVGEAGGASIPSLPSLPSLHLSQNPYRMSWAFGRDSPNSSPEKARSAQPGAEDVLARSTRPSLSITTTPVNSSPVPASPIDENLLTASPQPGTLARPSLVSAQSLPLPPPFEATKSSDSGATLLIRNRSPTDPSTSPSLSASTATVGPSHAPARDGWSSSSPPVLRRANSYAPSSSSPRMHSATPLTRSPLSSPAKEQSNPLGPPPTAGPSSSPNASPSLARTLIQTRAARSHSDASDRRSPPSSSPYTGARGMVVGGFGIPPGGGVFASAGLKVGQSRPGTADGAVGGTRGSVFGSLGSFFSSSTSGATSQSMSRSSSAATSSADTGGIGGTPVPSPGLGATGEVSEFGALFDGGGDRRSSSLARPGTGRKRGLSVGAGIGSLFGSSHVAAPAAPPAAAAQYSPSKLLQQQQGRARSGSASSTGTHGSAGLVPAQGDAALSSSVGGRMRALTDPSKRFSLASFGSGSGSTSGAGAGGLAPPGSAGGRPVTADGVSGRSRGNSVTLGSGAPPTPGFARPVPKLRKAPRPRVEEGETPEDYVRRLLEGEKGARGRRESRDERCENVGTQEVLEVDEKDVDKEGEGEEAPGAEQENRDAEPLPKGEVTRVLASCSDPFHLAALQAYLGLFPFHHLPLDIALRVFLSSASLPSETQQIDRVMEAFARRYCECNPGLFGAAPKKPDAGDEGVSAEGGTGDAGRTGPAAKRDGQEESDIPYVLAFSMVMLNTDQFNPNAKSKMTKADYVKNTRIDGVAPEILEYLYDQITAAPFIYVNDDDPATSPFSPSVSTTSLLGGSLGPSNSAANFSNASGSGFFGSNPNKSRLDPYHLIATGQTQRFKVDVESLIPTKSPFSFTGTTSFFDATKLHGLFARAPVLQISSRPRASSKPQPAQVTALAPYPPSPDASCSALPAHLVGSPLAPTVSNGTFIADPPKTKDRAPVSTLKITKIGLLSRKEDLAEGGKKAASRKWRGWSVILTGSQLLFFKDPHFAGTLHRALQAAAVATEPKPDDHQVLVFSWQNSFKPDAVLSLAHSAAIYDSSYSKYRNVFRLVAPAGRQYLFQAHDAAELNSWLHAINYAAAFKTAGMRIRALQPTSTALSTSQRSSPAPTSPHFGSFAPAQDKRGNGHPDLPQPAPRLVRSDALGSLASTAGSVSDKGSLGATDGDVTLGPVAAGASTADGEASGAELVLPVSLQQALEANGANGKSAEEDDDDVPLADLATPQPPDLPFGPPAQPPAPARSDLLRTRIQQLDTEIRSAKEALQADLRLAKHLAILTPFRHSTRERVLTAIPPIEKRVRHARIQLAKLVCYREVLSRDLLVEDREAERLLRKQSLHRSHSRRTSSQHRQRSPPRHVHHVSRHATIKAPTRSSALSRGHASLHPDSAATSDAEHHGRSSFESTADSFSGLASDAHAQSLTDDELDRLQVRSPPLMQRSKTETDWACVAPMEHLALGDDLRGLADRPSLIHGEDELEPRPPREGGMDTPYIKRGSFGLLPATPSSEVDSPLEQRSFHLPVSLEPPVLETRRSH